MQPPNTISNASSVFGTIKSIFNWFEEAKPEPTRKDQQVQLGVHFEEVAEMLATLSGQDRITQSMLTNAYVALHGLALHLKTSEPCTMVLDRKEFLDAICDQIVTAVGCGHDYDLDLAGAVGAVDLSNYSKFVDGKAIFDDNGKIAKGPGYFKPDLTPYV